MKQLLFSFLLCTSLFGFGQCPSAPIILSSQADVDNFVINYPNCTEILEGLHISGADIYDLSPLSNIVAIRNTLYIRNNPLLPSLNGLNNIILSGTYPGWGIEIVNNNSLNDINALSSFYVEAPIWNVFINNNPTLGSLNGMQFITTWVNEYIEIKDNYSLTNLQGLNNIIGCEEFYIENNDNLTSLNGLDSFETIGTFHLINNDNLISLNSATISVQCALDIKNNEILENIDFFQFNDFCTYQLEIIGNPNLSICNTSYVCDYLDAYFGYEYLVIENNAEGCDNAAQVATDGCMLIPNNDDCSGSFFINIGDQPIEAYNVLGTASSYTPSCNDSPNRADVWFSFYSGFNTSVDILIESGYNVQLWQGNNCNSLTQVSGACTTGSLADISVAPSTYYYIQVWSCESCRLATGLFTIQVQDGTLSTPEMTQDLDLTLFPNPVNNLLTFNAQSVIDIVIVYSMHGQQILDFHPKALETTLDLQDLASGMYIVKVKSNGTEQAFKILKN